MPQSEESSPTLHHHHRSIGNLVVEHDHDPSDHDDDGRHDDNAFGDYDLLYGLAHYLADDHGAGNDDTSPSSGHNPYNHPSTHYDIDDAFD